MVLSIPMEMLEQIVMAKGTENPSPKNAERG